MSTARRWPACMQTRDAPPLPASAPASSVLPAAADPSHRRYLSWDDYFMAVAFLSAQRSKDPNKQAGRVGSSQRLPTACCPASCKRGWAEELAATFVVAGCSVVLALWINWSPCQRQLWTDAHALSWIPSTWRCARCDPSSVASHLLPRAGRRLHRGPEQRHLRHRIQRLPSRLRRQRGAPGCPPGCAAPAQPRSVHLPTT